ncbi:hypothetical protein NTHiID24_15260 [Haemophilus influenzae]|jgi:hypothetical protein|uniref:hypothetical protein n=1 Tax=Haemophilus influenzae TaxID=727 RepID=UPI000D841AB0|nr:hypothetical protein [Haemophilus influenzae]GBK96945.1 hypothetical protein NTHiID24_15260 [Haemophilus influenzae]DAS75744.1 MAG TPA: hypothetical protein [Caudoviricetes sp.]
MNDQMQKTLQNMQAQIHQQHLQLALQESVMGCLLRGLSRHPDLLDDVENEFHALIDATVKKSPELFDVLVPYLEKLAHRDSD